MAWRFCVDKLLQDRRVEHSKATEKEAGVDAFNRRVVNPHGPQGRINDVVEYRDHQNDGNRVDVSVRRKHVNRAQIRMPIDPIRER